MEPVLPGRVHGLKNQQQGVAIVSVQQVLLFAQLFDVFAKEFFVLVFRSVNRFSLGWPFAQIDVLAGPYAKVVGINLLHRYF